MRELLEGRPAAELFSWRSESFRALGLAPEGLDDEELLRLMLREPRLIRRPLVQVGGRLIAGADWKALEEALG